MLACGGAILAPGWVISSAHCFQMHRSPRLWEVMAGKHDLTNSQEECQQVSRISKIVTHEYYSEITKANDVALVKLKVPLTFTNCVVPIDVTQQPPEPSKTCTVTGWGSTTESGPHAEMLQEVNVTVMSRSECAQYYPGEVDSSMMCAGKPQGGADACQGDSGGPLSCFCGDRYELVGVVSWGVGCGRPKKPGVYTNLTRYVKWINSVMEDDALQIRSNTIKTHAESLVLCGQPNIQPCWQSSDYARVVQVKHKLRVENIQSACPHSWPWQVSLQTHGRHYCTGTLIHRDWVLAAYHCNTRAKTDTVVLGIDNLDITEVQEIPVKAVYTLPQNDYSPPINDVALIRLLRPARTGVTVAPVCLPNAEIELNDSWDCATAGWGTTSVAMYKTPEVLHQARLRLVDDTVCRRSWGGDFDDKRHLCASAAGSQSCMGISGAPLLCQKNSTYYLFGLLTWGSRQCVDSRPAVYTKLVHYHSWIGEFVKDL
ncbi:ovochymase-1 isoform X2 [Brienomyrus brachyistius]|nr:ovochymase-1 isoform X2 [Brienomyrus brachyistius]XP_048865527.1 ovochymase-1 isoform X2 [Brienomyrus brachyistius]